MVTLVCVYTRDRYHGDQRPSSDDSFHSPTIIPPSTLNKPSRPTMKRYHCRRTCSHTSPRRLLTMILDEDTRLPTMILPHETRFVKCRWWNDGWTVKTVVVWRSSASIPDPACGNTTVVILVHGNLVCSNMKLVVKSTVVPQRSARLWDR